MSLPEAIPDLPVPSTIANAVEGELGALDAPEATPEGWKVTNRDEADWVGRLRQRRIEELAAVRRQAERQVSAVMAAVKPYLEPIEEWRDQREKTLTADIDGLEGVLLDYHRREVESADGEPPITIKLPHVELRSRKSPDRWSFGDEFIEWARGHRPDLLREEVDKPAAKKALGVDALDGTIGAPTAETGELVAVPGVTVEKGERTYSIGDPK